MGRDLEAQKKRFAKTTKSKVAISRDEVGRWVGERLRAASGEKMAQQEIRLSAAASGVRVDKALM